MVAASQAQQAGTVRQIAISGNVHVTQEAILAAIRTKVGSPLDQGILDQDKQAIEDMGFFQAVDVQAKAAQPDGWQILVAVKEWPEIKEIRIAGNSVVSTKAILESLTVKPGQVYNLKSVKPSTDAINTLYAKGGYFARVDEFGPLKESPNTLNVHIVELTVGEIKTRGNVRTKPGVMARLIKTRPGDVYSSKKWEADLRRMYSTQWFESVKSNEDERREYGKVDLTADVKETRTGQFGVGLQIDPRSSLAGFIRLQDTNFRGSGQTLGANFLQATSGGGPSVDLDYSNPFWDNHDTTFSASVYSRLIYRFSGTSFGNSSTPTNDNRYTERRTGTTFAFNRPLENNMYGSIGFRYEGIKTGNLSTTNTTGFIKQDGTIGSVTFGLNQNNRDVDVDPSRGTWWKITAEPGIARISDIAGDQADQSLLGTNSFVKTNLEFRAYASPGQKPRGRELEAPRRVVAFRARYGVITGKVPFFEQYFAGGSDTIRGYPEDRFWGKQEFLTTLEYRHPLQKSFNLIGFVDYGGAWGGYGTVNNYSQSNRPDMVFGYGAGISLRTPLGPIRLDIGFDEQGKSRTHFLIGTSF